MSPCSHRRAIAGIAALSVIITSYLVSTRFMATVQYRCDVEVGSVGSTTTNDNHYVTSLVASSNNRHQTVNHEEPVQRVVFIKTHKTGSSTVASILQRYGYLNQLSFLVPSCGHILSVGQSFTISRVKQAPLENVTMNLLTNHARYNRSAMDVLFNGAHYITILREPAAQFQSTFYYFEMFRYLPAGQNTLEDFFEDPGKQFELMRRRDENRTVWRMHNQQLFDLGVEGNEMGNEIFLNERIKQFDQDFDLVLISEYFDESMVLLRKLLRWNIDDLRFVSKGVRKPDYRHTVSEELNAKIRAWNSADVMFYEYFNRTLWRKIREYGPSFSKDLEEFRELQRDLVETCDDHKARNDRRTFHARQKHGSPDWCAHYFKSDVLYTKLIRERMKEKNVPLYQTC